jgi:hypothetical protein
MVLFVFLPGGKGSLIQQIPLLHIACLSAILPHHPLYLFKVCLRPNIWEIFVSREFIA